MTMLKDDGFKPKIITPNDIGSLFGDSPRTTSKVPEGYDDDEDTDIDYEENEAEEEAVPAKVSAPVAKVAAYAPTPQKYDAEMNSMRELLALQKEMMAPVKVAEIESEPEILLEEITFQEEPESDDVDDYLNFDRQLDKVGFHRHNCRNLSVQKYETIGTY